MVVTVLFLLILVEHTHLLIKVKFVQMDMNWNYVSMTFANDLLRVWGN